MTAVTTVAVRLYDLAEARGILDEFLLETEGEVTPELEALLDQLDGQVTEKVERVGLYIREHLATAAAIKEEEQRLAARRKALERAAEGLKNYLQRQLERLGKTKVDGLLCTVAVQRNSQPSIRCALSQEQLKELRAQGFTDPGVPAVVDVITEYKLSARLVLRAVEDGFALPDGIAIEHGQHVRIR